MTMSRKPHPNVLFVIQFICLGINILTISEILTGNWQKKLTRMYIETKDPTLAASLGFKGGTCALIFYQLPRFSVDLDFDYIGEKNKGRNLNP